MLTFSRLYELRMQVLFCYFFKIGLVLFIVGLHLIIYYKNKTYQFQFNKLDYCIRKKNYLNKIVLNYRMIFLTKILD